MSGAAQSVGTESGRAEVRSGTGVPVLEVLSGLCNAVSSGLVACEASFWQWFRRGAKARGGKTEDFIPYAPAIATGVWITLRVRA